MIAPGPDPNVERQVRPVLRAGLLLTAAALAMSLILALAGVDGSAGLLLTAGLTLLVTIPVVNVLVVLVDEVQLKNWQFAAAAGFVLAVLIYNVLRALA